MAEPVIFKCPNCASPLRVEDWDTTTGIIKCSYCRALSTMPGQRVNPPAVPDPGAFRSRSSVPQPPGLNFEERASGVLLTRRWFTAAVIFMIPFCLVWDGFLVFWYTLAFRENGPLVMKLFPMLHVAVGVGLTYFTIASIFNTTRVSTENGRLRVHHGPLPWKGSLELEGSDVEQLYCQQNLQAGKNGARYRHEVWAVLRDGKSRKLLGGTDLTLEQALFIEQRLERALGIEDKPVPGEVMR